MSTRNEDVDITIRAKNATGQAFAEVSKSLKDLGDTSEQQGKRAGTTGSAITTAFGQVKGAVGGVLTALGPVGAAIGAAFTVTAIINAMKVVGDFAGRVQDTATRLGMTTDATQRLTFAAEQNSTSIGAVSSAIGTLSRNLVNGDAGAVSALGKLNLNVDALRQMKPDEAFTMFGRAVASVPDPMERLALVTAVLGRGGAELLPMFENLEDDMRRTVVVGDELIKSGDDLGDAWDELSMIGKSLLVGVFAPLGPSMKVVSGYMGELAQGALDVAEAERRVAKGIEDGTISRRTRYDEAVRQQRELIAIERETAHVTQTLAMVPPSKIAAGAIKVASIEDVTRVTREFNEELRKEAAETERIEQLRSKAYGLDAIAKARDMVTAIGGVHGVTKMSTEQQKLLAATIDDALAAAKRNGQQAPAEWIKIRDAAAAAGFAMDIRSYIAKDIEAVRELSAVVKDYGADAIAVDDAITASIGKQLAVRAQQVEIQRFLANEVSELNGLKGDPLGADDAIMTSLGKKFAGGGGLMAGISESIIGAVTGGGSVSGAIGGSLTKALMGSGIGKAVSGGLTSLLGTGIGGALNAALPGIGSLMGPLISKGLGALGGGIKKLFGGPSQDEKDARALVADYESQLQGLLTSQQRLEAGNQSWAMTVVAVRDAYLATGRSSAEAETAVSKMWASSKKGAEASKAAIAEINGILDEKAAKDAKLQTAIEKYGFTIEELGPKFKAQRLSEMANQLLDEFDLLAESGIEVGVVTGRMSGAINEYLQLAIRTGQEVPIAMKPIAEQMILEGKLLDANGQKITDVGELNVTWAQTMTQGFQGIADRLDRIIDRLGGVRDGLGAIPTRIETEHIITTRRRDLADNVAAYEDDRNSVGDDASTYNVPGADAGGLFANPTFRVIAERQPELVGSPDVIVDALSRAIQRSGGGGFSDNRILDGLSEIGRSIERMRADQANMPIALGRSVRDHIQLGRA